jgi:hypothetical protein
MIAACLLNQTVDAILSSSYGIACCSLFCSELFRKSRKGKENACVDVKGPLLDHVSAPRVLAHDKVFGWHYTSCHSAKTTKVATVSLTQCVKRMLASE